MPSHHIQRAVSDLGLMELATPFEGHRRGGIAILERGNRGFEITSVGHAIGTNWTAPRQGKFLPVVFTDKSPGRALEHLDPIELPSRYERDLLRFKINNAKFGFKAQTVLLRHDQQF